MRTYLNLLLASVFTSLLLIICIIIPQEILAAGTFNCYWEPGAGSCYYQNDTCDSQSKPDIGACNTSSQSVCNGKKNLPCIPASQQSCLPGGGDCSVSGSTCCPGTSKYEQGSFCLCLSSQGAPIPGSQTNGPQFDCAGGKGIKTAIGCIPIIDQQGTAAFFLKWGMGVGGGIALVMIVVSSYIIMSAAGDPRKLQAGKELLTAAISGLILIVFGAYILKVIGVDVLNIF